jgi:hypothetical protein
MARKKPIISPLGQWAYPGEVTVIPSSNITMKGVNYPVLGIDDLGNSKVMMPGAEYDFPGNYVTEYPQMGKGGQMIKRKDGSYSQRGLWDNIRANKGSGKKPTKEMLEQERKIKAKMQNGGWLEQYQTGGLLSMGDYDLTTAPKRGDYLLPDINRPSYIDDAGERRTEWKIGINVDGKETLIPTVVGGRQLTDDEAKARYRKTGLHMGQFNTPEEADYAARLRTARYKMLEDPIGFKADQFQVGGLRRPIYTSNPRDPRIGRYTDSLNLYNKNTLAAYNLLKKEGIPVSKIQKTYPTSSNIEFGPYNVDRWMGNHFDFYGKLKSRIDISKAKIKPVGYQQVIEGQDTDNYFPVYKKPVQPIIYKKPVAPPVKKLVPKPVYKKPEVVPVPVVETIPPVAPILEQSIKKIGYTQPIIQQFNYMSNENKAKALQKYGSVGDIPFQGVDINELKDGGWLDEFQIGGGRRPMYTSNPRDPRLLRFNDSMDAYNFGENQYKIVKKIMNSARSPSNADFRENYNIQNTRDLPLVNDSRVGPNGFLMNPYQNYYESYRKKPLSLTEKFFGDDRQNYTININEDALIPGKNINKSHIASNISNNGNDPYVWYARFKKPVAPIYYKKPTALRKVYKKPVSEPIYKKSEVIPEIVDTPLTPVPIVAPPKPSLFVSNIDRDMYTPGGGMAREYNIGVTLQDGSKKAFRTEKEYQDWKAANNLDISNAKVSEGRGYSYNYPENKKYGGWLSKYQTAGEWAGWTPNVGKPYMRTSPAGNAGYSDNTRVSGPDLNNRKAAEAAQYARKVGSISQGTRKSDYEKAREASSFVSQAERRKGSADPLDYVLDIFNPAAIGFAGVDLTNNLGSAASNTVQGNFAEAGSDLLGAGLNALSVIPAAAEFKGVVKPLSKFARLTPGQYKVAQQFANNPEKAISQAVSYASKLAESQIIKNPRLALSLQRGRPVSLDNINSISGIRPGDVSSIANFNKLKPNSISEHAFFRQLEKGVESLDNSLSKRVADLESEEGFRRLVEQEKAYLFDNTDTDLNVIDKVAKLNAKARIEELKNIKNVNKEATEYASTNFLGTGKPNPFVDNSYLYNNAYYQPASLYDQFVKSSGTLNLKKPTLNYSTAVPGEIGIGYKYTGDVPTEMHEIAHALQRGRKLSLDNGLTNIVPKKDLDPINQRQYKYFKKGSHGQEPTAFANELREAMFQKGFIPDYYTPINQQQVQDAYKYFKKNPMGIYDKNTGNFSSNTRIFDFMKPTKANSKLLTDVLNRLPAVAPLAVGTAAASQLQEQRHGGWLNKYQDGGENLPELNSKIDIANFYKNPLSEKYGIYQDPTDKAYKYYAKTKETAQPKEEYRQLPDLSNIDKQKLKEINAKKASLSETQLSNIQPVSPVILPKQRDQILRDKLYYDQDALMEQVIREFPIASPSYKEVLESIPKIEESKTRALPNKQKPAKAELNKNIELNPVQQFYADRMYNKYGKVILTDKANNRTIYGTKKPDGTWDLNDFEVLTGQASNFNEVSGISTEDLAKFKNKRGTPIGVFPLKADDNIYGYPGLRLDGSGNIAYHITYKGADDMNRNLLYNNNNALDNYRSYGCINCQKPSLEKLLKFAKPNDKALIINSNLGFKNNENWIKKNTPDLYNDLFKKQGGQTDWLNKYK